MTKSAAAGKRTAVALGLFDGVHLGHRAVISKAAGMTEKGFIPAAFTFNSSSISTKHGTVLEYIYTDDYKELLLRECGTDIIASEDFQDIRDLSGEEFVRRILMEKLRAGYVCCGRDFRFGKAASCGISELAQLGKKYGFETDIAGDVLSGGENISSRRIRQLLREGDISAAEAMLGKSYTLRSTVMNGSHIGRTIDFPTVNQHYAPGQLVPAYGVYHTRTEAEGKVYDSVTNVGVKPTISGERPPLAETHILGFSGDLYGKEISVSFVRRIRPEMKFGSLDELKARISADIQAVVKSM